MPREARQPLRSLALPQNAIYQRSICVLPGDGSPRFIERFADASVDRSPCGTGTCAVMAVVDAMGLLGEDKPFVHESLIGTMFTGRIAGRTSVGEYQAIVPEIEGSAWITGEHTFLVDDDDPLREGFRV